jgi:hypothetical protein
VNLSIRAIRVFYHVKCSTQGSGPDKVRSHMPLAFAASEVDETLAEIECQRELIVELMRLGQPTDGAELALKNLLGEFASMVEGEHRVLVQALETTGTA